MTEQEIQQALGAKPKIYYGYIVVAAAFVVATVTEGLMYSFGVFFEPLLSEFGWSRAMTSGAFSLNAIVHLPMIVFVGKLTDKLGSRQLLTACGFFIGVGHLLMAMTHTIWQLYLFYGAIMGIAWGLYWIPLISIVPRWFVKRRALMMGVVTSGIGVGQIIVPPLCNLFFNSVPAKSISIPAPALRTIFPMA